MKKLFTIAILLLSLRCFAQDSTKITIGVQTRDWEYIASFVYNDNAEENLYDSLKAKFRVANPPTGNTVVSVTAYTIDWLPVIQRLKMDYVAINANCASRIDNLLRALNQQYLTGKLDEYDLSNTNLFQDKRSFGRSRLRRQ